MKYHLLLNWNLNYNSAAMNRIIAVLLICLGLLTNHLFAQNAFEIYYQTIEDELLRDGIVDSEGNVVMIGSVGGDSGSGYDGIVFKVFPDGDYIYRQVTKQDTTCQFGSITLLDNGNYLITGRYAVGEIPENKDRLLILILNPELETVLEKTYLLNNENYVTFGLEFNTLVEPDGNIVFANTRKTPGGSSYNYDHYFMRFNQLGDTLLTRGYETFPSASIGALRLVPNSDTLMVIGYGYRQSGGEEILFLDHEFNVIEVIYIGQHLNVTGRQNSDIWLSQTEFLMTRNGITENKKREYNAVVSRLNTSGEFLQELVLNRPDTNDYIAWYKNMSYRNDSTIYIGVNQVHLNWNMSAQSVVYLIDKNMNLLGRKDLNDDAYYEIVSMEATADDGCMLFGSRITDVGQYKRDIYIQKILREDFELITSVEDYPLDKIAAKVWPNPADNLLYISLEGLEAGQDFRLRIYNTAGMKYLDKALTVSGNTVQCRIDVLPAGTYVYKIEADKQHLLSGKFIKK